VHGDEVAVALLQGSEPVCVPAIGRSAEEEVKASSGHDVL
jgi:hypothetical protein